MPKINLQDYIKSLDTAIPHIGMGQYSGNLEVDYKKSRAIKAAGKKSAVCSYFMVADIETSNDYEPGKDNDFNTWSYEQGAAVFDSESGKCIDYKETRDIRQFVINFLEFDHNVTKQGTYGIVFIHNLKYDLSFFRLLLIHTFKKYYPDIATDISIRDGGLYQDFLTDKRTWLYFKIHNIEFRCSWRLTNQSLYAFTKDMGVPHRKILGANDYGRHYSNEKLSKDYTDYMRNDTLGLGEAICTMLKLEGLNLSNVPYTATGFPRNDVKREFNKDQKAIAAFMRTKPSPMEFLTWVSNYSGGLTQANELYEGEKVVKTEEYNIKHRDFVSFYPSLIYTQMFPSGRGLCTWSKRIDDLIKDEDLRNKGIEKLKERTYCKDKLLFAKVLIVDFKMNDNVFPFIPRSHIQEVYFNEAPVFYSHKLKEVHGSFIVDLTTPELKMLYENSRSHYVIPLLIYEYKAERMPEQILRVVMKYFIDKSKYKYMVKDAEKYNLPSLLELKALLQRSKGKLNGIYGMLCEMIIKDKYPIDEFGEVNKEEVSIYDLKNIKDALDDYYGSDSKRGSCKNGRCLSYAHGCYVTAWAKYFLFKFCTAIGWENVLYVDTDSAFYKSTEEIEKRIQLVNDELHAEAVATNAYCEVKYTDSMTKQEVSKTCWLHYFDDEEEDIEIFKTLNAKRYMYYTKEHGLTLTCAGIAAGTGLHEDENGNAVYTFTREMEIAGHTEPVELTDDDINAAFNNFKNGTFIFNKCGGTTARYSKKKPHFVLNNFTGHYEYSERGIAIVGVTKMLKKIDEENKVEKATEDIIPGLDIVKEYILTKLEDKV